jgi:hypothetical protein
MGFWDDLAEVPFALLIGAILSIPFLLLGVFGYMIFDAVTSNLGLAVRVAIFAAGSASFIATGFYAKSVLCSLKSMEIKDEIEKDIKENIVKATLELAAADEVLREALHEAPLDDALKLAREHVKTAKEYLDKL